MAIYFGQDGEIQYKGNRVAKVKSFSLDSSTDVLDVTTLGDSFRQYVGGMNGASGSVELLFDAADTATLDLMKSVYQPGMKTPSSFLLYLNKASNKFLQFEGIISQFSWGLQIGEIVSASASFTVSGPVTDRISV